MSSRTAGIAAGAVALALGSAAIAGGDGSDYLNPALLGPEADGCSYCVVNPPDEGGLPFRFDWSMDLRGSVTDDGSGERRYRLLARPALSLEQETIRGGFDLGLSGELTVDPDNAPHLGTVGMTAGGRYDLDEMTRLEGRVGLTLSQDAPGSGDLPANVATAPLEVSLDAEASATRDLGPFVVALRGSAGRDSFGETTHDDASSSDNAFRNVTSWGAGTRLGYRLAPGLVAFIDGEATAEQYDEASPTLLVKLDNLTQAGRTGLTYRPSGAVELEGSVGLGYRDFGEETLDGFTAMLYGAKATLRPDEALTLTGEITTTIGSPGTTSGSAARLEYAARASGAYQLNPWLRLRASAGWSRAQHAGVDTREAKWWAGTGLDYLLSANTDLVADYSFERSETTPSPATHEHQLTVGVRVHR